MVHFYSTYSLIGDLKSATQISIEVEPQLVSCNREFTLSRCGPLMRAFIDQCEQADGHKDWISDVRVHMLMPGWYPCIPGWHIDDVPRTRSDGQPDHTHPAYNSYNYMAVQGIGSQPAMLRGHLELEDLPIGAGIVYSDWHTKIENAIAHGDVMQELAPYDRVICMPYGSFHKGMPAIDRGFRLFMRLNFNTRRVPKNKVRTQTQVYLVEPFKGW